MRSCIRQLGAKLDPGKIRFHLRLAKTTRNRELIELLTRKLEKTVRLMYIECVCSRFRETEFQMLHGRIVVALLARDAKGARNVVLKDIIKAQQATLRPCRDWPSALSTEASTR
jgi:DNA-binding FadR family transcriptional regulator